MKWVISENAKIDMRKKKENKQTNNHKKKKPSNKDQRIFSGKSHR